jgi:nucleoside 2-deoxyribosyltransferase
MDASLTDKSKIDAAIAMPYGQEKRDAWRHLNTEIGENNRKAIDQCDGVLAVLDGVDVDSGTAAKIGYAYARGKRIVGYRGDFRLSSDNEGSIVNLQVEYFINQSGGRIIKSFGDLPDALTAIFGRPAIQTARLPQPQLTQPTLARNGMDRQAAATVVLAILLALIVRAALEATFKPVFAPDGGWSSIS